MFATAINHVLDEELAARRAEVAAVDGRLLPLVDRLVRFTTTGGKRLRPRFLWSGWVAAGGEEHGDRATAAHRAAASLELIQACALAHDDIIDNSDTRRGEPSLHVAVGIPTAILLGDFALAWADDMFVAAARELDAGPAAFEAWRGMRTEVLAGQLLDLTADGSAEDARQVNRYKTAAYTVERPLHLGAALAGGSPAVVRALREYGVQVGMAFQLRDDLLGVFGDAAVTGKPAGDDLVEGKHTLLLAYTRDRLDPTLLAELTSGVGRPATPEQVRRLASIVAGSGAPDAVEREIDTLVDRGLTALNGAGITPSVVTGLTELARSATQRVR